MVNKVRSVLVSFKFYAVTRAAKPRGPVGTMHEDVFFGLQQQYNPMEFPNALALLFKLKTANPNHRQQCHCGMIVQAKLTIECKET